MLAAARRRSGSGDELLHQSLAAYEMDAVLPNIVLPDKHPFAGVYVAGHFAGDTKCPEVYRCYRVA